MIRFSLIIVCMHPALSHACDEIVLETGTIASVLMILALVYFGPVAAFIARKGRRPRNALLLVCISILTLAMAIGVLFFTREALFGLALLLTGWLMPAAYWIATRKRPVMPVSGLKRKENAGAVHGHAGAA